MGTHYENLIKHNLSGVYRRLYPDMDKRLPAMRNGERFEFRAFGADCSLGPDSILLNKKPDTGPRGLIVSLYALHASPEAMRESPFVSYKDIPGTMPYHSAFSANSETVLVPVVERLHGSRRKISDAFSGKESASDLSGDFNLILYPLPKIALAYIFYLPDDEFPASATCLFSSNATVFMPLDGLADLAEYTSKQILEMLRST